MVEPVVRIPKPLYAEMVEHVVAGYPNEACGALGVKDGAVVRHYPTDNAAEQPDDFSIIAPDDLLRIYDDIDEYDGEMIYYHSHPKSEAYPSRRDKDWAKRNKLLYIIFSHQHYPEPPYARVFLVQDDDSVIEGKIELV
ncbi:MAG TPA: M67 family metallopeptidase [Ktedonobacteraceae bacterium]|jgi:proteasome lid subunit RPN8/RPN11|nr:M67 family metallopeptidase [Ktedonobacteraceae bacterium]